MFQRFRKDTPPHSMETFPSVTRHAIQANVSYAEAAADLTRKGTIKPDDPRAQLDPAQIRTMSERRMDELLNDYQEITKLAQGGALDARTRSQYAAVIKAGSENLEILRQNETSRSDVALASEFMAFRMGSADPKNPNVAQMHMISAACCERAQRERVSLGFDGGNISKAAKTQGRSWIEVRDDLVRHNLLDSRDPRRKIRVADIEGQKTGVVLNSNTLPAADLEDVAMSRLKKNPKDEMGMAWLACAGHLASASPSKDLETVAPTKSRLFAKFEKKRQTADVELS